MAMRPTLLAKGVRSQRSGGYHPKLPWTEIGAKMATVMNHDMDLSPKDGVAQTITHIIQQPFTVGTNQFW